MYTIVFYETAPTSRRLILSEDGLFCSATNRALKFKTRRDAEDFAKAINNPRLLGERTKAKFIDAVTYADARKCTPCVCGPRGAERVVRTRRSFFFM